MNIFVLSNNPKKAAQFACDQHVVKMLLETAQLMCSSFEPGLAPYKRTHYNHPCSKWARESYENFQWLAEYGQALGDEYFYRFNKRHKSEAVIKWCWRNRSFLKFNTQNRTPFVLCMPDSYKFPHNAVLSYRTFYIYDKSSFARWENGRKPPYWYWNPIDKNAGL